MIGRNEMKQRQSFAVNRHRMTLSDIMLYLVMILAGIITLFPFLNVAALSFNDAIDSVKGGIYLFPRKFTMNNYIEIFKSNLLLMAFRNSVLRTVIGTVTGVICCAMVGYTVSRRDFMVRRLFSLMLAITMYVSGGLIPDYILIRNLGLFNNFLVYILPALVSVWNVFVIRSYIDGIPDALQESARIDGANDIVIFFKVILPLCLPVLATVALFTAVGQWNAWFDTYLFCNSNKSLTTLQYELQKILTYASVQFSPADDIRSIEQMQKKIVITPDSLKMAMTMVTITPILFVYPFVQRYFITGMTLGAVKS